jgi:hypothetical protein
MPDRCFPFGQFPDGGILVARLISNPTNGKVAYLIDGDVSSDNGKNLRDDVMLVQYLLNKLWDFYIFDQGKLKVDGQLGMRTHYRMLTYKICQRVNMNIGEADVFDGFSAPPQPTRFEALFSDRRFIINWMSFQFTMTNNLVRASAILPDMPMELQKALSKS